MCYNKCGSVGGKIFYSRLNFLFGYGIKRARSLVKNYNARISYYCAGNGNPLPLTARKFSAVLAYRGVYSVGQLFNNAFKLCRFYGVIQHFRSNIFSAVGYVFLYCARKKYGVLRHYGYEFSVRAHIYFIRINSVYFKAAAVYLVKAYNEIEHR